MPKLINAVPQLREHKPSGQARVRIDGREIYLGKFGSAEAKEKYDKLVAEWLANQRRLPAPVVAEEQPQETTVGEVLAAFWDHALVHYRDPEGNPTGEAKNYHNALRPVRRLYNRDPAAKFGPLELRAVRDVMIRSGLARKTINARINRVRRVFRWAASMGMIPAQVYVGLKTVDGLQEGRSPARESRGVRPVCPKRVEATLPFMPRPVAAMVRVQLLTGCRMGEVVLMRGCDLKTEGAVWEYRPRRHKNSWRGQTRVIMIGPRAREVMRPFLKPDPKAYIFDPRDAVAAHHADRRQRRKSRPTPSEIARRKASPGQGRSARYDRRTYRQAVIRACDRAFLHPTLSKIQSKELTPEQRVELREWRKGQRWFPLQLRHTRADQIERQFGIEGSQLVLGHAAPDTTLIYLERDLERAREIMGAIG
jgi:integrase